MYAEQCCGSCEYCLLEEHLEDENYYKTLCDIGELKTIMIGEICPEYKPYNPMKSKHEKMWWEIKEHAGQTKNDYILDLIGQVEEKYNKEI